jgi:hypothetical protein
MGRAAAIKHSVFSAKFADLYGMRLQKERQGVVVLLCPGIKFDAA